MQTGGHCSPAKHACLDHLCIDLLKLDAVEVVVGQVTMYITPDKQLLNYTCKLLDRYQQSVMLNAMGYQMTNRLQNQDRARAKFSVTNPSGNQHRARQLRPFADLTEIVFLHRHLVPSFCRGSEGCKAQQKPTQSATTETWCTRTSCFNRAVLQRLGCCLTAYHGFTMLHAT